MAGTAPRCSGEGWSGPWRYLVPSQLVPLLPLQAGPVTDPPLVWDEQGTLTESRRCGAEAEKVSVEVDGALEASLNQKWRELGCLNYFPIGIRRDGANDYG